MRKIVLFAPLLGLLFLGVAQPVQAQSGVGAHLGTSFGGAFFGAQLRLGGGALQVAPSIDLSLSKGEDRWQINGDLLYRFGGSSDFYSPYLGAGLGVVRTSGGEDTAVGLNTLGGLALNLNFLQPYAQARVTFADGTRFDVMAGLLVRF
jgi:hypothetical protein